MKQPKIKYREYVIEITIMLAYKEGEKKPSKNEIIQFFKESISDYDIQDFTVITNGEEI
jgi:hypothetical protein